MKESEFKFRDGVIGKHRSKTSIVSLMIRAKGIESALKREVYFR